MQRSLLASATSLLAAAAFAAAPACAVERTVTLDPQSTEVTFLLGATGHDVHGILHLRQGVIRFDTDADTASGEVSIDARLTETGNKKRDKTLHVKVLESAAHPLLVFHPRSIRGDLAPDGRSEVELVGTVTLVGHEHPLAVPATIDVDGDTVTATAAFSVPFVEWGLHDPSTFILKVAKQVAVSVNAHGSLDAGSPEATAAARR
jgi:polyisoprenoid-binding protein YceI